MKKNVTIYKKYDGTWVVKFHRALSRRLSKYEEIRAKEAIRKALVATDKGVKNATIDQRMGFKKTRRSERNSRLV